MQLARGWQRILSCPPARNHVSSNPIRMRASSFFSYGDSHRTRGRKECAVRASHRVIFFLPVEPVAVRIFEYRYGPQRSPQINSRVPPLHRSPCSLNFFLTLPFSQTSWSPFALTGPFWESITRGFSSKPPSNFYNPLPVVHPHQWWLRQPGFARLVYQRLGILGWVHRLQFLA